MQIIHHRRSLLLEARAGNSTRYVSAHLPRSFSLLGLAPRVASTLSDMVSCEDLQATRSWVVEVLAVQVDAAGKMRNLIPGTDPAKSESKPENGDIDIDIVDEVVDSMPRLKAYVEHAFALAWWTPVDNRDASARLFEKYSSIGVNFRG